MKYIGMRAHNINSSSKVGEILLANRDIIVLHTMV